MDDKPQAYKFDFQHWLNELIEVGKKIEPAKYTPEHITEVKYAWAGQSIVKLHQKVLQRRRELMEYIDPAILQQAINITGMPADDVRKALLSCGCSHIEAMDVYLAVARFPGKDEAAIINEYGFEFWRSAYNFVKYQ